MTDPTEAFVEAMARAFDPEVWDDARMRLALPSVRKSLRAESLVNARAALTALRQAEAEAGWQAVPVEATEAMLDAAERVGDGIIGQGVWSALVNAAPKPPGAASHAPARETPYSGEDGA